MTLPGVSVLDAAFVFAVVGVAAITSNPLGAGLAAIVGAAFMGLSAFLAYRNQPE